MSVEMMFFIPLLISTGSAAVIGLILIFCISPKED